MRPLINPRIEFETDDEQTAAGRHYPGLVLVYRHRRIPISSGQTDTIRVWTSKDQVLVMSYNARVGYAGLEEFSVEKKFEREDAGFRDGDTVFFQNDWELPEDFFGWAEHKMRDHLHQYLQ